MNSRDRTSADALYWLLFLGIIFGYSSLYAPYGLENNDGGFILGLAYQFFLGNSLYDQIIYVRPPVSPILHSFVYYPPFSYAPVLIDRIFFFAQIATYSALSALLAKRLFVWGSRFTAIVATLIFIFSAHTFPPMGWHTVDGIFFSVIAIYILLVGVQNNLLIFISAVFAILAAGTKQPYYLTPIILLMLSLAFWESRRAFYVLSFSFLFIVIVFFAILKQHNSVESFLGAISSQTNLKDLFSAGVMNYIKDISDSRSIIGAWPIFIALCIGIYKKHRISSVLLIGSIFLFLAVIAQFYITETSWGEPLSVFDSVFIFTFLGSFLMLVKARERKWFLVLAMHTVAWSASISWGYLTAILYAAPSVITLAYFLNSTWDVTPNIIRALSIVILPLALLVFYFGHQYSYSLEGAVPRNSITQNMEDVSPALKLIKAPSEQFHLYKELLYLTSKIHDRPFIVLPNIPLVHMLAKASNPIGIDWPLNAEIGNQLQKIQSRMDSSVDYALIYSNASPSPDNSDKFGSDITIYVIKNWQIIDKSEHFVIYANPLKHYFKKI